MKKLEWIAVSMVVVYLIAVILMLYWQSESHEKLMEIYEEALQFAKVKE